MGGFTAINKKGQQLQSQSPKPGSRDSTISPAPESISSRKHTLPRPRGSIPAGSPQAAFGVFSMREQPPKQPKQPQDSFKQYVPSRDYNKPPRGARAKASNPKGSETDSGFVVTTAGNFNNEVSALSEGSGVRRVVIERAEEPKETATSAEEPQVTAKSADTEETVQVTVKTEETVYKWAEVSNATSKSVEAANTLPKSSSSPKVAAQDQRTVSPQASSEIPNTTPQSVPPHHPVHQVTPAFVPGPPGFAAAHMAPQSVPGVYHASPQMSPHHMTPPIHHMGPSPLASRDLYATPSRAPFQPPQGDMTPGHIVVVSRSKGYEMTQHHAVVPARHVTSTHQMTPTEHSMSSPSMSSQVKPTHALLNVKPRETPKREAAKARKDAREQGAPQEARDRFETPKKRVTGTPTSREVTPGGRSKLALLPNSPTAAELTDFIHTNVPTQSNIRFNSLFEKEVYPNILSLPDLIHNLKVHRYPIATTWLEDLLPKAKKYKTLDKAVFFATRHAYYNNYMLVPSRVAQDDWVLDCRDPKCEFQMQVKWHDKLELWFLIQTHNRHVHNHAPCIHPGVHGSFHDFYKTITAPKLIISENPPDKKLKEDPDAALRELVRMDPLFGRVSASGSVFVAHTGGYRWWNAYPEVAVVEVKAKKGYQEVLVQGLDCDAKLFPIFVCFMQTGDDIWTFEQYKQLLEHFRVPLPGYFYSEGAVSRVNEVFPEATVRVEKEEQNKSWISSVFSVFKGNKASEPEASENLHFFVSTNEKDTSRVKKYKNKFVAMKAILLEFVNVYESREQQQAIDVTAKNSEDEPIFEHVTGYISEKALDLVRKEAKNPHSGKCSCATQGYPCTHVLVDIQEQGRNLYVDDFHPHWRNMYANIYDLKTFAGQYFREWFMLKKGPEALDFVKDEEEVDEERPAKRVKLEEQM